ncbi:right-handed parallel beta-helix repeat-containing protein [Dokdonella sp.]|uniref:right-handed parallel beta-helix repeat-containing protein n=1 Tax=Dokdonella sp. TaxID=2291710 RepID=UPI0025C2B375|nr:right-handed parallel beta-helix repeat-containing protein [Dokdonella sp.]
MPASLRTTTRHLPHRPLPRAIVGVCLGALGPTLATAAAIVVTSPGDRAPTAPNTCTLRQAILSMNAGMAIGGCSNTGERFGNRDRITFARSALTDPLWPGTIVLADSADTTGNVGGTLLVTAGDLTIDGSQWRGGHANQFANGVTIARRSSASNPFGILRNIAPAGSRLRLNGMSLRNGKALPALCGGLGDGGGICSLAADLTLIDSYISDNTADNGGGIASNAGTTTLTNCEFNNNVAYRGGAVLSRSGRLTITGSRFTGNGAWTVSRGGAISAEAELTLVASTISGNSGKRGAALHVGGTAQIAGTVVDNNASYYFCGGLYVADGGIATVTASTFHHNFARYDGGAICVAGTLNASNVTITGNSVYGGGGGITLWGSGMLYLDHLTVAQNQANGSGGGISHRAAPAWTGSATIDGSIISGNIQGAGSDLNLGSQWSGTSNLIASSDARLGPLQDNGGATPTMLPGPDSAALDAIAPQDCTLAVDQRGVARPQGAGCDIGAVEVVTDSIFANGFDATP